MSVHQRPGYYWLRDHHSPDSPESWVVGEWTGTHWLIWEDALSDLEVAETVIGPRIAPPGEPADP